MNNPDQSAAKAPGSLDAALRPLNRDGEDVSFREPWEVQSLAVANGLIAAGAFSPQEWAEILGQEIRKAQGAGDSDDGSTYYLHVIAALERLAQEKGLTDIAELQTRKQNWISAYEHTPHGQPVTPDAFD